jgi:ATP-binding cassette, subfamily B, multidrug efflux pump
VPAQGGGPFGMPAGGEKAQAFLPSARRLVGRLRPEAGAMTAVILLGVVSVVFSVIGPKILGNATNIIFAGFFSKQFPAGTTKAEIIANLRDHGQGQLAGVVSTLDLHPGQGIDFSALSLTLGLVLLFYVASSVFSWLQAYLLNGVTQRTVYRLRRDVEAKIHRLPLTYFDRTPRGELLSRVTNDIDNISQSLQQTVSQMVISVLTVIGVLAMMFSISWLLALIALVTVPLTLGITVLIGRRAQKRFIAQWASTGALNAQIEEGYTGHALVKVFGRH